MFKLRRRRRRLGIRRFFLLKWKLKGVLVRKGYWNRKDHIVKLLNRNCKNGKKYKSFTHFSKALHLLHLFSCFHSMYTRRSNRRSIRRYLTYSFDRFFYYNRPLHSKRIKIRKKKKNKFVQFRLWERKMPCELIKWFWLLTFSQPFKKAYQRYAFILLDLIFFIRRNMFKALIRKVKKPIPNEFQRLREKKKVKKSKLQSKRNILKRIRVKYLYIGSIR